MKKAWPLMLGVCVFGAFIAWRSVVMPMTHDEASTWLNYRHLDVWSCLSNYACWGTANNHWLNTWLLQWSASIFGEGPWAIRLPNVLGGIAFFIGAAMLSLRYVQNRALQVAAFLLLVSHIYVLDFFSLARGYGLMVCGVIWAIYALLRYTGSYAVQWLIACCVFLVWAVLSNFTALLPLAAIAMGWMAWLLAERKYSLLIRHGWVWGLMILFLGFLLRYPIKMLSAGGEFEWGSPGPWSMLVDLFRNLLYGSHYVGASTHLIFLWLVLLVVGCVSLVAFSRKKDGFNSLILLSSFLVVANLLIILLQQYATGSQAPVGRKTIYLVPFLFLPLALGLNLIKNRRWAVGVSLLVGLSLIYHTRRTYPWTACREWYYDAYYPQLFSTILPAGASSDTIALGSSWIFVPSLMYYQTALSMPLKGLAYQKTLEVDTLMQYYFLNPPDTTGLVGAGFVLDKTIGPFYLFKNNSQQKEN